jgi:hypothetical protein
VGDKQQSGTETLTDPVRLVLQSDADDEYTDEHERQEGKLAV